MPDYNFPQSIIVHFLIPIISAYVFLIIVYVIMGWLVAFGVVNIRNPQVRQIYFTLERIANFTLGPIRQILPPIGGLDLSPIIAIFGLYWVRNYVLGTFLMKALASPGV